MSKVSVNIIDILEIERNNIFLGNGKECSCYFLNNNLVIKIFKTVSKYKNIYIKDYTSPNIAFSKDIYYLEDSNLIKAYTMNYLKGKDIYLGLDSSLLIDDLIKAYNKIRKEIENFPNIYMADLVGVNILYDNSTNEFNIIDTSEWYKLKNGLTYNINNLNYSLLKSLFRTINLEQSEFRSNKLRKLYQEYKDLILELEIHDLDLFMNFISELVAYNKEYKDKVKTILDLKRN